MPENRACYKGGMKLKATATTATANTRNESQDLFDDPALCAYLTTNPRTLRLWRRTRGLPFIRISSKVIRYRRADVDRWLASRSVAIVA